MNSPKTIAPRSESKKLLSLPTRQAEQLFQSYEKQQQLDILSANSQPEVSRETLLSRAGLHRAHPGKSYRGCTPSLGHDARHRTCFSPIAQSLK